MESITKNRQPDDVLRAMIARAYGDDAVPEGEGFATELGDGFFNVAYRVRLRTGRGAVLKIAPPAHVEVMTCEREIMRNELAVLALLAGHPTVPVPAVEHADLTHELVDADWFAMSLVEGESLAGDGLPEDQAAALHRALGEVNRTINQIRGPHFGPLHGPRFATWRDTFETMVEDILRDGERAGVDLGLPYARVRALMERDGETLDEVVEPRLVEWDLWPGNVLVADGRIAGIIDHERALYGDPLIEAGFNGLDDVQLGDPTHFVAGYGLGELTVDQRRRRSLYTVYLLLLMIIETRYRAYPDDGQYVWARGRLAALMERIGA